MSSQRTPWWLWPALAVALAVAALVALIATPPAAMIPPDNVEMGKWPPASPSTSPPVAAASAAQPAVPVLRAVVTVDGLPRLALVDSPKPVLVQVGEVLPGGAAVLAIEPRALVLRDGGVELRLVLDGAVVALASLPAPAPAAASTAQLPPPGYGAIPMPPQGDERAGSGNAAFRAAVEDKARTMRQ